MYYVLFVVLLLILFYKFIFISVVRRKEYQWTIGYGSGKISEAKFVEVDPEKCILHEKYRCGDIGPKGEYYCNDDIGLIRTKQPLPIDTDPCLEATIIPLGYYYWS